MKKFSILILSLILSSCYQKSIAEEKARHQAQSGERLNESQKNTDPLFKEIN